MKKLLLSLSTILIVSMFAMSQTIILSSDMETWSGSYPVGWGGSKSNIGTTNVVEYTTSFHNGTKSCQLINTSTSTHKRFTTTNFTVIPMKSYEIKFWVRGAGQIRTGLFDGRTSGSGYATYNSYVTATSTWTEYTQTVVAETSADTAQFILSVISTVATDNIQIDDVTITEMGAVTPTAVTIHDIQFTTATPANSPYNNQLVTTKGVVTAKFSGGFYIQDGAGAWNGILVISTDVVTQGDSVQVTGYVSESFYNTQIATSVATVILNGGMTLPTPAIVTALQVNFEDYEGCLVAIQNAKCTDVNSGYGMWKVEDATDTTKIFDQIYAFTPALNIFYNVTGPVYYAYSEARICPRYAADVTISSNVPVVSVDDAVSIYPNPASVSLSLNNINLGTIYDIVDVNGKVVVSTGQYLGQPVNIQSLQSGTYYLKLYNKQGVSIHTFVKE